ncbi:unnamed protein product [Porites evermanni]|uniref:Uncharacterized protein n=1 Tax=Porites evermanni TaxID=104178 RepID=A0ABN8MPF3_9CNID|nr:unnamed protein product [Porites evermanni]
MIHVQLKVVLDFNRDVRMRKLDRDGKNNFPTSGTSVCHFEFIVCPAHEVYPCYNAVLLEIDELRKQGESSKPTNPSKICMFTLVFLALFTRGRLSYARLGGDHNAVPVCDNDRREAEI